MQKYLNKKKAILLLAVLSIYVVIITPLLVINLQKRQEIRGRAQITIPTPTPVPYDSGELCLDTGFNYLTGLSNWVIDNSNYRQNYGHASSSNYCGTGTAFGYYWVRNSTTDVTQRVLTVKTPYLPKAGKYQFRIKYRIGNDIAQTSENMQITIGGQTFDLRDGIELINNNAWTNYSAINVNLNAGVNQFFIKGTGNDSVHVEAFRLIAVTSPTPTLRPTATITPRPTSTPTPRPTSVSTPIPSITSMPTSAQSCGNVPTDTILVIDRSGSMKDANKLIDAKEAATKFVDVVSQDTRNRIGLVSFSTTAALNTGLTNNFASVKTSIASLSANGYTCQECAVVKANQEIATNGRAGVKKVVIMLTDGEANYIVGGTQQVSRTTAESRTLTAVTNGFNTSKTVFFTIGFGTALDDGGYNPEFLRRIATLTGGKYYYPAPGELNIIYKEISELIGKGLIGGLVFNDTNGDGIYASSEAKLSGITVNLISGSATIKSTITNSSGFYTLGGLCDGSYRVKQTLKAGWMQTLPTDPNGYSVTITNASQYTNKNFGTRPIPPTSTPRPTATITPRPTATTTPRPSSTPRPTATITPRPTNTPTPVPTSRPTSTPTPRPTSTITPRPTATPTLRPTATTTPRPTSTPAPTPTTNPTPANTFLSITAYQHGIGNSGDNTNPNNSSLSNKNPLRTTITANLELFDVNNKPVGIGEGSLTYNNTEGNYQGSIGIYPNTIPSGKYYLKVKTTYHLRRLIDNILTITAGQNNIVPAATLVTGDSNNDNKLSILDYNMLLGCYSDLSAAVSCDEDKKLATDFNDDSFVNQIDYNLFLREIATQPGE